ncbi:hypothetical protein PHLCEN_2v6586 [Hermanssonia centrifuga]|uniref:Proteasome activator Blm10 middle HEAT repeats region domain-containing protein n=1 Tax=Hermanssonia centrifuga TaxID=98765 RepID=A0A2R6NZ01_9APHY|nr:hypothetical protein PHLCEN_2v6586 [Hermanssonia centrifuga]
MAILRGCLGYGGAALLKYREQFIELVSLLVDKTKSERGYTGTGRLISRILHTVASVYPINTRFVNTDKWNDPEFNRSHNIYWGSLYEAEDVKIEWHGKPYIMMHFRLPLTGLLVPSTEEIDLVLEILDKIASPALDKVGNLLATAGKWDNVDRNDFCRPSRRQESLFYEESEVEALLVTPLALKAGFVLEDPSDPRYQKVVAHRLRFGNVIHRASVALQQNLAGEDHIDAVISVSKAIDVYLLEYAMTRTAFDGLQKAYTMTREYGSSLTALSDVH